MAYSIAGLLSVCILGGTVFLGYRLFNWVFTTNDILAMLGIYIAVGAAAFVLAFINGLVGHILVGIKGNNDIFALILGLLWAGAFIALAIYPWFKGSYTTGLIIIRALGSFFSLGGALWAFLMVSMISSQR